MDLEEKIRNVQSAIQQVEAIKSHLDKNTSEVKNTINNTFLRHLRSLWNRQVFLANQADLIRNTKEEVLHRQLVKLHMLLSSLRSQLGTADQETVNENCSFDMNDLRPEETPYISFRGEITSLQEAIVNYGRVDHSSFPHLTSHFMDPRSPAASLPPHFEDYDDAEHHVLYKTLEEVKQAKTNTRNIDVHIPKLSARPEDWLTQPSTTTTASVAPSTFAFPTFSNNMNDWLKEPAITEVSGSGQKPIMSVFSPEKSISSSSVVTCSSVSSSGVGPLGIPHTTSSASSIDTWLQQIKLNPDMEEEDDFEIVDGSGSIGTQENDDLPDQRSYPAFTLASPSLDVKHWTATPSVMSDSVCWLKSETSTSNSQATVQQEDTFASYFANRDNGISSWLASSKNSECCENLCCDKPKKAFEIEDLGNCLTEKLWLKSSSKKEEKVEELKWLCKANEPCQSFTECLGTPSCVEEQQVLVGVCTGDFGDLPGFSIFKHTSDSKKWLVNGGKNVEATTKCAGFEHFQKASREVTDWLLQEENIRRKSDPHAITSPEFLERSQEADTKIWLRLDEGNKLPEQTTPLHSCTTWDKILKQHKEVTSDQWLLPPASSGIFPLKEPAIHQEKDQEIWLLHKENMETETPMKDCSFHLPPVYQDKTTSQWLLN